MTTAPSPAPTPPSAAPDPTPSSDRGAVRSASTAVALGVAMLVAAVVQSAVYSRSGADGDLDWAYFGIGLGAAIVLLLIAPLAVVLVNDAAMRTAVGSWPAAFGALALGLMVAIGMEDGDAVPWVVGGIVLGLSVVGYLLVRGGAPTVTAIVGLGILYARAFDEVVGLDGDDAGFATGGAGLLVFVVGVTVLGWALPATRALTGVVVGVIGVIGYLGIMAAIGLSGFFGAFVPFALDSADPLGGTGNDLDQDTYITLAYAAGLLLLWSLASFLTQHPGFRVLIVTLTASILPLAVFNLGVDDPNWVALGAGVLGAVVVLLVLASGRGVPGGHRGNRRAPDASAPPAAATSDSPTPAAPTPAAPTPAAPTQTAPGAPSSETAVNPPPSSTTASGPTPTPDPTPPAPSTEPKPDPAAPAPPPEKRS